MNEECKVYFDRMLTYGAETWTTTKKESSKIKIMEINFFRIILNKTKKGTTGNTNIIFELGVDEIKNDSQKSRIRWF